MLLLLRHRFEYCCCTVDVWCGPIVTSESAMRSTSGDRRGHAANALSLENVLCTSVRVCIQSLRECAENVTLLCVLVFSQIFEHLTDSVNKSRKRYQTILQVLFGRTQKEDTQPHTKKSLPSSSPSPALCVQKESLLRMLNKHREHV